MRTRSLLALVAGGTVALPAQSRPPRPLATTPDCSMCATWNTPQPPVRIHGNTWYVGTQGLAAILVTSPAGHVLIDGGLEESAPLIAASIRSAGFRLEDVRWIVVSHVHYDHAGGIAQLQRASGAQVAALAPAVPPLRTGRVAHDDPQHGELAGIAPVASVRTIRDLDTLRVGAVRMVAHHTGGHTAGGTSWSWQACDSLVCRDVVYADSQSPISATGFRFTGTPLVEAFRAGQARLAALSCDILVTPHPDASQFWQRVRRREAGDATALVDREACRTLVTNARTALERRLASEAPR